MGYKLQVPCLLLIGLLAARAAAQPEGDYTSILRPIFEPVVLAAELMFAIAFGVGIVGFMFLIGRGLLNWSLGGAYGRTAALRTFMTAAELLAILPLTLLVVEVLKNLNVAEAHKIATIMEGLLQRGLESILRVLSG